MIKAGYNITFIYGDCFACDYAERLLKRYNMFEDIKKIHSDSDKGIELKKKYNFVTIPNVIVSFDDSVIKIYRGLERNDILEIKQECFI